MKAVLAEKFGTPESFRLAEIPTPACGPDHARVSVQAAGVSFVDCLIAAGKYQLKPPLPFIPGSEFAGIVLEVGRGVEGLKPGDRVAGTVLHGAFAEQACVEASRLIRLPDNMNMIDGAVFRVGFATAYHALVQRAQIQVGEIVLVLGAAGSVGTAAIQVAKVFGAAVIAVASTPEKRAAAITAGADQVIATDDDLRLAIRQYAPDGVDIVVDPVGGFATEAAFRQLRWGGRHLIFGFASGAIATLPANLPLLKGAALIGVDIRQLGERNSALARQNLDAIFALYGKGKLAPLIRETVGLADFSSAMEKVASGTCGRIVLRLDL